MCSSAQVAFAKVREKTGVARRNQHRIALTNKVKDGTSEKSVASCLWGARVVSFEEYLMYTNSRGKLSRLAHANIVFCC